VERAQIEYAVAVILDRVDEDQFRFPVRNDDLVDAAWSDHRTTPDGQHRLRRIAAVESPQIRRIYGLGYV